MWTAFFDDYSFSLLGLTFAKEGKKAPPFSDSFSMLGLSVNLQGFKQGKVEIGHTSKRAAELDAALAEVIQNDRLDQKESERLRGRMNFFEGHAYGRGPAQALRTIDHFARSGATTAHLPTSVVKAVEVLRARLTSAIPLQISARSLTTWFLFTDGSCEPADGLGAVGGVLYAFSERAPTGVMQWLLSESQNPIYEFELYPVLFAFRKWQHLLAGSQLFSFVDNDAAKYALVKSCSSTAAGALIVDEVRDLEQQCQAKVWYARVPTHSSPADRPSRLDIAGLERHIVSGFTWDVSSTSRGRLQAVWTFPIVKRFLIL